MQMQPVGTEPAQDEQGPLLDDQATGILPEDRDKEGQEEGFGEKDISAFGGFTLLANNITGPAMVAIPLCYQQAGFFTPTVIMLLIMVVSSLSSTMLCRAMALIPGNSQFQERHELVSLAKYYFNQWGYYITLILFILSLQSINIAAIIESAQTMDLALLAVFDYTGGVEAYPNPGWAVQHRLSECESLFADQYLVSIGFVIVMALCVPLGYVNLDDNVVVQEGAFWAMIAIIAEWMVQFFVVGLDFSRVPFVGKNQAGVLGTLVFNYAFVVTVPSWRRDVSINKTIWLATGVSTVLFVIVGWLGALAFPLPPDGSINILQAIESNSPHGFLRVVSQICVYLFPAVVLLSGIPIASIIIRYNLLQSGLCGKAAANFWAVLFPWFIAAVFYTGSGLQNIIVWTGVVINGVINFVIPLLLYIVAERNASVRNSEADAIINADENDPLPDFYALPRVSWLPPVTTTKAILVGISILLALTFVLDIIVAVDPSLVDDGGADNSTCASQPNKTLATRLYSRLSMLRSLKA